MGDEIAELKSVLRSLVVSSPTQVDVRTLLRDYRNMLGAPLPATKYGYRDPLTFLKERFSDCFIFTGLPSNPILTLIVPNTLKHIDQFVQKQKVSSVQKHKGKRRSIPETILKVNSNTQPQTNSIVDSFRKKPTQPPILEENKPEIAKPDIPKTYTQVTSHNGHSVSENKSSHKQTGAPECNGEQTHNNGVDNNAVRNFFKKRLPLYDSTICLDADKSLSDKDGTSSKGDSGRQTSSTSSSTKMLQLEQLKSEILELLLDAPDGIWCTDLIRLYRERYKREMNFSRFGFTSIISLAYALDTQVRVSRPDAVGDWRVTHAAHAPPPPTGPAPPRVRPARVPPLPPARAPPDSDDALPGIDFDPDVFPADCLSFMESIPDMSLADFAPGAMLEVIVGEVYSPSHFWLIRLGDNYNIAMEDIMDEMTRYYNSAEGRQRVLARGAVRVGQYCSCVYEGDWHRALVVHVVDSDTVKVRHVDYGTVDTVAAGALRPLPRRWASLPPQAVRARLAAARPSAGGRRWPHAASAHFLRLVRDKRLVANVVAVDHQERAVEVLLIDTSGASDVCLSSEMVRSGHADPRPDAALWAMECYLFPRFEALESGATPNYAEVHAYLRDGIALDFVDAYRRHVPAALPPSDAPAPAPAPAAPKPLPPPAPPLSRASSSPGERAAPPAASVPPRARSASVRLCDRSTSPDKGVSPPSSPAPAPPSPPGTVSLSVAECEAFRVLSAVEPSVAHAYMAATLARAMAALGHPAPPGPHCPFPGPRFHPPPFPGAGFFGPQFVPVPVPFGPLGAPPFRPPPVRLDPMAPEFRMIRPPPGF